MFQAVCVSQSENQHLPVLSLIHLLAHDPSAQPWKYHSQSYSMIPISIVSSIFSDDRFSLSMLYLISLNAFVVWYMEESISFEFWKIVSYSDKMIERYRRFGATSGCRRIQVHNLTSRDGLSCAVSVQHTFCWALWAVCHFWRKCLLVRHTLCSLCLSLLLSNSLSVSSSPLCPIPPPPPHPTPPHLHHLPSLIFHASFSLSPPEPPVFLSSSVILACVSLSTSPCTFKSMCHSSLSLMPSVCCILSFFCFCPSCLSISLSTLSEMASADARPSPEPRTHLSKPVILIPLVHLCFVLAHLHQNPPSSVLCTVPLVCHC